MKKLFALLFALVLVVGCFAACQKGDETTTAGSDETTTAASMDEVTTSDEATTAEVDTTVAA